MHKMTIHGKVPNDAS